MAVSRRFFEQHVLPIVEQEVPEVAREGAFGLFGLGSEAYGLDDEFSRDHHWGLRIDLTLPEAVLQRNADALARAVAAALPAEFEGVSLREGHVKGAGLAPESLEAFLDRTIGLKKAPESHQEWLSIPEEDIVHVINGEIWHDPSGRFTALRSQFDSYYPEPVWLRRLAHWSRYYSGMGCYALHRALMRGNELYASIAFGKAIRLGVQLAFLLDRVYFPYDKWLLARFTGLPRMYRRMGAQVEEAVKLETPWLRKQALLDEISDVLDQTMVEDGLIPPHPAFVGSATSGYRLLEHAYTALIHRIPSELQEVVPNWDQIPLERFHSRYVAEIDLDHWDELLCLKPRES